MLLKMRYCNLANFETFSMNLIDKFAFYVQIEYREKVIICMINNITWEHQKSNCIQITDELLQHSISQVFRQPIKCHFSSKNNPNNIQPQILNLGIIKERIENETYQSYQDWLIEMKLFFNTITHKNVNYLYKICANSLNEEFEKLLKKFEYLNEKEWNEKCRNLKSKIDNLLKNSPDVVKSNFPPEFLVDYESSTISNTEADYISRCSHLVKMPSDILSVMNIIKTDPSPVKFDDMANVSINIRGLHKKTLFLLMEFFKKRFPEEPIIQRKLYPIPIQ